MRGGIGRRLLRELEVASEHRLGTETSLVDDSVNMEEEVRVPLREVSGISLRHRSKSPFYIIGKVLIMVFLINSGRSEG